MNAEIIVPISVFAMVIGIVYMGVRHKERMNLIRSGVSATSLETKGNILGSLKWGMIFIGIGLGIIAGKIIATSTSMEEEAAFFFHDLPVRRYSINDILYYCKPY